MSPHEQERLSAYLDEALPPDEHASVQAHLAGCAECREHLAALAAVDPAARELAVSAPEGYFDSFASRVRGRIEADPARGRGPSWRPPAWSWAVAAALLLAVVTPLTLRRHGPALPEPSPAQAAAAPAALPSALPVAPAQERRPESRERTPLAPAPASAGAGATAAPRASKPATKPVAPQLTPGRADVAGGLTRNEAAPVSAPPPPPAETRREAEAKAASLAPAPREAADAATLAAAPAAAPPELQRRSAMGRLTGDADEAFRRLEGLHPTDVSGWRAQRDRWRAFAESYPAAPLADEARVRAVVAGFELLRLGGGALDAVQFRRDAEGYLSREDAAQKPRVRALLEAAGPSR